MKKNGTRLVCVLLMVMIVMTSFIGLRAEATQTLPDRVLQAQKKHFKEYPDITMAEGMEIFFGNPQWAYDADTDCVRVSGEAEYEQKPATFVLYLYGTGESSFAFRKVTITMEKTGEVLEMTSKDELMEIIHLIFGAVTQEATEPAETTDFRSIWFRITQPTEPKATEPKTTEPKTTEPKATEPKADKERYCATCGGTGYCKRCIDGSCDHCFGEGADYCSRCYGGGDCQSCYGSGGDYRYSGGDLKWRTCYSCGGRGNCGLCSGRGTKTCYSCNGSGNCYSCNGSAKCPSCRGTGKP